MPDPRAELALPKPVQATKRKGRRTLTVIGTLAAVSGLVTFLSWGLDFIAFPALVVTAAFVAFLGAVLAFRSRA